MKKIIITVAFVALWLSPITAQTSGEWFNQKSTQKKYLMQQIAALQVYISYAKKGYNIVSGGLNTIRDIKKGDLNIHNTFFNSLKAINPKIARYQKVADIISYQIRIIKQAKQTMAYIRETKQFSTEEIEYNRKVFDFLLQDCLEGINELLAIITSGELEMKDNERLTRIDKLYTDMQDKYTFCTVMSEDMALLAAQRMGEYWEIQKSKLINGMK
ncbi:MAG: hypothetical protein QM725_07165 [Lacibacter sp.]|jgi:hypothetical protein|nr:hypothetical protein [Ferruginibacter sp.]HMP20277.1 hypothetical protein [Ferruginibacter sp.]